MTEVVDLAGSAQPSSTPEELFALDILMGLSSKPKMIPPKYFYDDRGSELFQKITQCEDYYPTRCELEIFQTHGKDIVDVFRGSKLNIVELGVGDGHKTKILLRECLNSGQDLRFVPIDISKKAIDFVNEELASEFSNIEIKGIISEYFTALRWLNQEIGQRNLVLFLGSNIGNFSNPQARVFLRTLWNSLNPNDYLLMGFDLKKDLRVLHKAYNDDQGITAQFNLNLLDRMNRELKADFDLSKFQHFGSYNVALGAMESHLVSLDHQTVNIKALNKAFRFVPYEPIHVEYSFKYLEQEVEKLMEETGFSVEKKFFDSKGYFMDALIRVKKD